ncbi:hypothetical protein [Sedimenticola hydrogenitrophicus]|uniref:hypothetical protein n=1 Tax=Sedimenticola hydrogenitrophicus TaxID=2967975 RepID=UPI0023AFC4D9|nr:hypothetical protein [Sedimenticola hydrogenitrophicus]
MNYHILLILGVLGGLFSLNGSAANPNDCYNPFTHSAEYPPAQLRQVAKKCDETAIANLFYNRAYHAELLDKFQILNRLQAHQPTDDLTHYHTQRIFIALAEAFADRAWTRGEAQAITLLNRQYDRSIEIAEYQLRGYDKLAAHALQAPANP